jgi:hypothetical protein
MIGESLYLLVLARPMLTDGNRPTVPQLLFSLAISYCCSKILTWKLFSSPLLMAAPRLSVSYALSPATTITSKKRMDPREYIFWLFIFMIARAKKL